MTPGLVSVVMPVYNGAEYLPRAIQSVLDQSHCEVELVAVDDGSTDDSAAILESYDDRVHVHRQENCGNVGAVRNRGIELSRGEFVSFLDQDDWWAPEKLERQVERFRYDERVGLVHTSVRFFDDATESETGPLNPDARPEQIDGECFEELLLANPVFNSSVMVRRSTLDRVGPCDTRIPGNTVQDYDLWLRVAERFRVSYVEQSLTWYRMHSEQGMWDRRRMLHAELEVLLRHRTIREWRSTAAGRRRLSSLYDGLAVSHYEHADIADARAMFRNAWAVDRTVRQGLRYACSLIPRWFVEPLRSLKQRTQSIATGRSTTRETAYS